MSNPYDPDQPWPPPPPPSAPPAPPPPPPSQSYPPPPPGQSWPPPPAPGQSWPAPQPAPGQPYPPPAPGQSWPPAQPVSGQPWPAPQPVSGQPWPASGQPYGAYPPAALPTPPKRNGGKIALIVAAVLVPVLAICGTFGYFVLQGVKEGLDASPSSSPTPDITAVPEVGTCYDGGATDRGWNARAETNQAVDCQSAHKLETIAAGTVPDAGDTPPARRNAGDLYQICSDKADAFLGAPWYTTKTWVVLSLPSRAGWVQGAHWYRCDLASNEGLNNMIDVDTTGTLGGGNAEPITCVAWRVNDDASDFTSPEYADCDQVHNGELAGGFAMPADLDINGGDPTNERLDNLCRPIVLGFLGRSSLPSTLSYWFFYPDETRADGRLDQNVLCVLSAEDLNDTFNASLKDLGSGSIPFST